MNCCCSSFYDALDQIMHVPDPAPAPSTHGMQLRDRSEIIYQADIELQPGTTLTSSEQEDLETYYTRFKSKEFLLHQSQGLPTHITENAYETEESSFLKTCSKVPVANVPKNTKVKVQNTQYIIGQLSRKQRVSY